MTDARAGEIALNRALWAVMNERFTDAAAQEMWARPEVVWGLFAARERDLGVLGEVRDLDVLELACGTGILTRRLRERLDPAVRLVASDLSKAMLDFARSKLADLGGIGWREADAAKLPFGVGEFGTVVC